MNICEQKNRKPRNMQIIYTRRLKSSMGKSVIRMICITEMEIFVCLLKKAGMLV